MLVRRNSGTSGKFEPPCFEGRLAEGNIAAHSIYFPDIVKRFCYITLKIGILAFYEVVHLFHIDFRLSEYGNASAIFCKHCCLRFLLSKYFILHDFKDDVFRNDNGVLLDFFQRFAFLCTDR